MVIGSTREMTSHFRLKKKRNDFTHKYVTSSEVRMV